MATTIVAASMGARCGREDQRRPDRVALVRHGRGAAAARFRRLRRLAHLDLHHQRDVSRRLGERADHQRAVLCKGRHPYALGEPGCGWQGQLQRLGDRLHDKLCLGAQRREASRSTAELHHLRLGETRGEPALGAVDIRRPAGDLLAERQGCRGLQKRATEHWCRAMLPRELSERCDDAVDCFQKWWQSFAELQDHRRVEHVLAGGAPMHILGGPRVPRGHLVGQRLDHRNR
jgi:hypothetical protein